MSLDKGKQKELTFATEAERLKAREQFIAIAHAIWSGDAAEMPMFYADQFDKRFPPVVEAPAVPAGVADYEAMLRATRSPNAREAAFVAAVDALLELATGASFYGVEEDYKEKIEEAHARVLALYAEAQRQGERDQLALAEQVAEATMRMEQGRAERLTAGEEVVRVVNPEYPGDKHYGGTDETV